METTSLDAVFSDQAEQSSGATGAAADDVGAGVDSASPAETDQREHEQGQQQAQAPEDRHSQGLQAAVKAERQRRQDAEAELARLKVEHSRPKPQQQSAEPQRPKRDQYDSQESYEDALLDYGDQRRAIRSQRESAEQQAQEQAATIERTAAEVIAKGAAAYADFDDVLSLQSPMGQLLAHDAQRGGVFRHAILAGERAHEVAYHLGKNPDEAARIYSLPPVQMVRAIALVESRLPDAGQSNADPVQASKPVIPKTLTQSRDTRTGQFQQRYDGPTPLNDILARKA